MGWAEIVELITQHWETIKTALLLITPPTSAVGSWWMAHKKLRAEAEQREVERKERDQQRVEQQRQTLHSELVQQSTMFTDQFRAVMDAAEARNEDLWREVKELRIEVASLRKTIDNQRLVCVGCPKLPLLTGNIEDGRSAVAS